MAHTTHTVSDPAADTAALLHRMGIATLAAALPIAASTARRGVVLLLPIGIVLLVLAAALRRQDRMIGATLGRVAGSPTFAAVLMGIGWAGLSLLWTPKPFPLERLTGVVGTLALALAGFFAMPERVRAANLYLIPIGTAVGAVTAAALLLVPALSGFDLDGEGRSVARGVSVVVLFAWPGIAWLRSRNRDGGALMLALAVAGTAALAPGPVALIGLAAGALVFGAASLARRATSWCVAALMVIVVLFAPVLPSLLLATLGAAGWSGSATAEAVAAWREVVVGEPRRLLTGYGLGTLFRARLSGLVPAATPEIPLVQIWYDLGLVGALSAATALWCGARGVASAPPALGPGLLAALVTAFTMSVLGTGSGQAWWPSSLVVLTLLFVAIERGQFRTRLPKASLLSARTAR